PSDPRQLRSQKINECPSPVTQRFACREYDLNMTFPAGRKVPAEALEHGHEAAVSKLVSDQPGRQQGDTQAIPGRTNDDLTVIRAQRSGDAHRGCPGPTLAASFAEIPTCTSLAIVRDQATVRLQIRRIARHSVCLEVSGTCAENSCDASEPAYGERGASQTSDANSQIELFFNQVRDFVTGQYRHLDG